MTEAPSNWREPTRPTADDGDGEPRRDEQQSFRGAGPARVEIVEARADHCPMFTRLLRDGDRRECEDAGIPPRKAVWRSYRASMLSWVAFIDGEPAAIFGLGGGCLSDVGRPWLLTTATVERHRLAFVRHAKIIVTDMLSIKPVLENHVSANYPGACRLIKALGFTLGEPEPFGRTGAPFRKFRKEMV